PVVEAAVHVVGREHEALPRLGDDLAAGLELVFDLARDHVALVADLAELRPARSGRVFDDRPASAVDLTDECPHALGLLLPRLLAERNDSTGCHLTPTWGCAAAGRCYRTRAPRFSGGGSQPPSTRRPRASRTPRARR